MGVEVSSSIHSPFVQSFGCRVSGVPEVAGNAEREPIFETHSYDTCNFGSDADIYVVATPKAVPKIVLELLIYVMHHVRLEYCR